MSPIDRETLNFLHANASIQGSDVVIYWEVTFSSGLTIQWDPVEIDRKALSEAAEWSRNALENLQSAYPNDYTDDNFLASQLLVKLARAGERLFDLLIPEGEYYCDAEDNFDCISLKEWFLRDVVPYVERPRSERTVNAWIIEWSYSYGVPIFPIGLVFTKRPTRNWELVEGEIESPGSKVFDDFWALSYGAFCYNKTQRARSKTREPETFSDNVKLWIVAPDQEDRLARSVEQIQHHDGLSLEDVHVIASVADFKERDRYKPIDWQHFFYIDLSMSTKLTGALLLDNEHIRPQLLKPHIGRSMRTKNRRRAKDNRSLVFIDQSPVLSIDDQMSAVEESWSQILISPDVMGFIGVECAINNRVRANGLKLVSLIFDQSMKGQRLSDTIMHVRRQLWPHSLFYGVYARADHIKIDPLPAWHDDISKLIDLVRTAHDMD